VGNTYQLIPKKHDSALQPSRRQSFTVGLLPSGPEPVPATINECIPTDTFTSSDDLGGQGINAITPPFKED